MKVTEGSSSLPHAPGKFAFQTIRLFTASTLHALEREQPLVKATHPSPCFSQRLTHSCGNSLYHDPYWQEMEFMPIKLCFHIESSQVARSGCRFDANPSWP